MEKHSNTLKEITNPCIWMQSGVVKKKNCTHYFDCATCKYDTGMAKMAASGRHITWQEAMRNHDSTDRTCRHAMTGRTDHRTCPMNYNCARCDFDQAFEETLSPCAFTELTDLTDIKGFKLPSGHFFHSGHTWARMEDGGGIRVGMDDFSFRVLGNPDGVVLPLMGQELNQGNTGWGIKRQGNQADVQSPVNGVITKVNLGLAGSPENLGNDPYTRGWLFTVHNSNVKEAVAPLMDEENSPQWLNREISQLETMIEEITGPLSTDGGILRADVYGTLPTLGWHNLVNRFLGT